MKKDKEFEKIVGKTPEREKKWKSQLSEGYVDIIVFYLQEEVAVERIPEAKIER